MDSLKLPELKQLAKERGIVGFSKMKRQQLITVLNEDVKPDVKPTEDDGKIEPTEECEGGVCLVKIPEKKKGKKNKDNTDSVVQDYLKAIADVPVSSEIIDKITKTRLVDLGKQLGITVAKLSKTEIFQQIVRIEIEDLLKEL